MTSSTDLKNHHISILHYWNKGVRSARAIHHKTKIPLRTIYYNINKLKQTNSLKHRGGNGRPRVLRKIEKNAIAQYIPIENLWSIVKRKVEKRKPTNIDELELFLCEEFKNVDVNIVVKIVMSMKKRINEKRGEHFLGGIYLLHMDFVYY